MMFQDETFWQTLVVTLKFAVVIFIGTFFFAMLFALLSTKKSKLGKVSQMLYALPIAIAHATSSVIFRFAVKTDGGLLNSWLGTDIAWIQQENTAFWVVSVVTIWTHISGSYLYLLAGFRGVSEDIQEAAIVDGANGFTRAVKIKKSEYKDGKKVKEWEEIEYVTETQYFPPNMPAIAFWLTNHESEKYSKNPKTEISGDEGGVVMLAEVNDGQ